MTVVDLTKLVKIIVGPQRGKKATMNNKTNIKKNMIQLTYEV